MSWAGRARAGARQAVQALREDRGLLCLHLGTATGLLGFCMTDPIPLRSCSIISSAASIYFALTRNPILSYVPVIWSSLFITVNAVKISNILLSRLDTTLTEMEEEVYTKHFMQFGMRPRQFKQLLSGATLKTYPSKSIIETETMFPSNTSVKLLTKGKATVFKNKSHFITISANNPICFIGDMSLLELEDSIIRVEPFLSCVKAEGEDVIALEWEQEFLLKILREKSEVSTQLRSVLTNSVMRKLIDIDKTNSKSKYITLLRAFAIDGIIDEVEKKVLQQYKENHDIDEATHARGLATLGWTEEEFQRGRKQSLFSESLQKLQKKMMTGLVEDNQQKDVNNIISNIRKQQVQP